jgi:hypothetical protein
MPESGTVKFYFIILFTIVQVPLFRKIIFIYILTAGYLCVNVKKDEGSDG